jgi:superfamily II DNA helicase RecQ
MYPLKALAIDQETKALSQRIDGVAYVDMLSSDDLITLKAKLMSLKTNKDWNRDNCIILMMTAQSISYTLYEELNHLSKNDLIDSVIIDEIHAITEDGRTFRSEFLELKNRFFAKLSHRVKAIGATATCNLATFKSIEPITSLKFDRVIWGPMARRDVFLRFEVVTPQAKMARLKEVIKTFLQKNPLKKVLVYSTHAKS